MRTKFGFIVLSFCFSLSLLVSCSNESSSHSTAPENSNLYETNSLIYECNDQLLQSFDLAVLSTNIQECLDLALSGDDRCSSLAEFNGLDDLHLEFYLDITRSGSTCGCRCAQVEIPQLSPCAQQLQEDLSHVDGWENAIFFENNVLLGKSDQCAENSENRCVFKEGVTELELEFVSNINYQGENWCGCQCQDTACALDSNTGAATQYDEFGNGSDEPYRIHTGAQLYSMSRNVGALDKNYELCKNIDLHNFYGSTSNSTYFSIGSENVPFSGSFNGNNHAIQNFTYSKSGPYYSSPVSNPVTAMDSAGTILRNANGSLGFFGKTLNAKIQNVSLNDVSISMSGGNSTLAANYYAGGLIGQGVSSLVDNVSVGGVVTYDQIGTGGVIGYFSGTATNIVSDVVVNGGPEATGGVIGSFSSGTLTNSYAKGDVICDPEEGSIGGLVGVSNHASISRSSATGKVSGGIEVGGLVGINDHSTITESWATGSAAGSGIVGGLVGANHYSSIRDAYATGSVSGQIHVGGFAGTNSAGNISNSYASGDVLGGVEDIGGFIGVTRQGSSIEDVFSAQKLIIGQTNVGFMFGRIEDTSISSIHYWTGVQCTSSCTATSGEIGHLPQSYFYNPANAPMNQWDFTSLWSIDTGNGLPFLQP
ncbi:MAG: hypothetical protein KDD48_01610 [Bdellovibrionales bacterium]|nr:hypothetical protein [Bdellovibrionales bacterium]